MPRISVELPKSGSIGDIEEALIRSGLLRADCADMAHAIYNGGVSFGYKLPRLAKLGIDPEVLVKELRSIGLVVRWSKELA